MKRKQKEILLEKKKKKKKKKKMEKLKVGRKPIDERLKKQPITIFVTKEDIDIIGREELREMLNKAVNDKMKQLCND